MRRRRAAVATKVEKVIRRLYTDGGESWTTQEIWLLLLFIFTVCCWKHSGPCGFFFSFSLFDDMLNAPISYQVNKMTVLRGGNQIEGMTRDPK
jgi:hypothetical protein